VWSQSERIFLGHVLIPLQDVDTIHSSDEVEGVAVKRYDLHSLPTAAAVDSSAAFTALRSRTDEVSRAYVDETERRADGRSLGISTMEEWAVPAPEATSRLISKFLQWVRVQQQEAIASDPSGGATLGELRYRSGFIQSTSVFFVGLVNISGIRPLQRESTCNFSIQVEVYPDRELDEGPFCLKDKTLIYPQRTELLFDLQTETDNDDDKQDSRYQFSFDLTKFGDGDVSSVNVVFHLFFHYNTCKVHRGAFVRSVEDVNADRDGLSEGNFSALPEGLSKTAGFSRVAERSKDFAKSWTKMAEGKSISDLFNFRDWAKL